MTVPVNNAVAIYQYVTYDQFNTCRYGDVFLVGFYDDSLKVRSDGSIEISNGIPSRAWIEANRHRISKYHAETARLILSHYGL